jgi:hypothetical protein
MSHDNAEIIRRMTEAVRAYWAGSGAWDELLGPFYDPDVDYYPVRKWPNSGPYHGIEGLVSFFTDFDEAWERSGWEVEKITPVSDDRVLMKVVLSGAGRGSGMELAGDVYLCFWLRGGRIFRQEDHLTEEGARRGLGLAG